MISPNFHALLPAAKPIPIMMPTLLQPNSILFWLPVGWLQCDHAGKASQLCWPGSVEERMRSPGRSPRQFIARLGRWGTKSRSGFAALGRWEGWFGRVRFQRFGAVAALLRSLLCWDVSCWNVLCWNCLCWDVLSWNVSYWNVSCWDVWSRNFCGEKS